ncbi:hypothetical protein HYDPIDRAFT_117917 [Hydnomerulius pinastri MD-312]|uniref:DUF6699 domain-containing protein n=1 Tax=Hydnomerulius pinastri MD-312 TaxID=994086 RepID=A0A0C9VQJ2_9AGAM|nr:hypothetical protein HYDPIDRAFT_117917 [Hydnomerulius pinastri MD-312]
MGSVWDDIPGLVDANSSSRPAQNIPPPPGATMLSNGQAPFGAPTSMPQYPWGATFPGHGSSMPYPYPSHPTHPTHPNNNSQFHSPQDPYDIWRQQGAQAYQQLSMPSPYIPSQPPLTEREPHDQFAPLRRTRSQSAAATPSSRMRANTANRHSPWPSQGELSPLFDHPSTRPTMESFASYPTNMHTPSSTLSRSTTTSGYPPEMYRGRPTGWRRDFKFRSGLASMFRTKSSSTHVLSESMDSAKLNLHPFLRPEKSNPPTIYDLRRDPFTLVFRELDRPPSAIEMSHSVTYPPTQFMRLYHSRLPWYIDIAANGAPYISLADFFQQLFGALDRKIAKADFYNDDLDDADRHTLSRAWLERCRDDADKMQGVKRIDFLRGKIMFEGLVRGKNGMWHLKTAAE